MYDICKVKTNYSPSNFFPRDRYSRNTLYTVPDLEDIVRNNEDLCDKKIRSTMSLLRVYMTSTFVNKITRSNKTTFTDQLANLGLSRKLVLEVTSMKGNYPLFSLLPQEASSVCSRV